MSILKNKNKFIKNSKKMTALLLASLMVLTGCGNSVIKSNSSSNEQSTSNEATGGANNGAGPEIQEVPSLNDMVSTDVESIVSAVPLDYDSFTLDTNLELSKYDDGSAFSTMSETKVTLSGSQAEINGDGITINSNNLTITKEGVYRLSGNYDGQIIIDADKDAHVNLILDGVTLSSENGSPISVAQAKKTLITIVDGSNNTIADKTDNTNKDESTSTSAAIYSKDDLTISGNGSLTINSTGNGIACKDKLKLLSGNYTIDADNNGLKGNEYIAIYNGSYNITAGNDGIDSTTDSTETAGFVTILDGNININTKDNGIDGEYKVDILGGTLNITTSEKKGIKSDYRINIGGGNTKINSKDDAIHSKGDFILTDGTITVSTEDDAFNAYRLVNIDGGNYTANKSYEGIEALYININGGEGTIYSSDDGLNANGTEAGMGGGFGGGNRGNRDMRSGDTPVSNENPDEAVSSPEMPTANSGNSAITITGGTLTVIASGDGIDSNGSIKMTGGTVYVDGPTNDGNGALDYGNSFVMSGGTLIAAGSSGMAQSVTPDGCYAVMINFTASQKAGTTIKLTDKSGKEIVSYTPTKTFSNIVICTPQLSAGEYNLLAHDNTLCSFTIENASTSISSDGSAYSGGMGGFGGGNRGDKPGGNQWNQGGEPNMNGQPNMEDMPNIEGQPGGGNFPGGDFPGKGERPNRGNRQDMNRNDAT